MTEGTNPLELSDRATAVTTQGHALSDSEWLDAHYAAAREAYEAAAHFAGIAPGWRLLDAGAGGGSYLPLLSALVGEGGTLGAVDLAPENVEAIRRRAAAGAFRCPVAVKTASVTELPYDDGAFDAVWCANVVQYLDDAELLIALDEFRRVVRPGGLVIIKDSDFSAVLLGTDPLAFWRLVAGTQDHPQFGVLAKAYMRTVRLPQVLRQRDLAVIRRKTFVSEWQQPLRPVDRRYLSASLPLYGALAASCDLPAAEQTFWRRVRDVTTESGYLHSADFYYREAFALIVAQRPATA